MQLEHVNVVGVELTQGVLEARYDRAGGMGALPRLIRAFVVMMTRSRGIVLSALPISASVP